MVTDVIADVGALGTAVGVVFAGIQLVINRRQARTQFEDGLSSVYRGLIAELPVEAFFDVDVPVDVVRERLGVFYRYFDLCNEQAFLHERKRIADSTWQEWLEGIGGNLRRDAFQTAWFGEIAPRVGHDFQEFRVVLDDLGIKAPDNAPA